MLNKRPRGGAVGTGEVTEPDAAPTFARAQTRHPLSYYELHLGELQNVKTRLPTLLFNFKAIVCLLMSPLNVSLQHKHFLKFLSSTKYCTFRQVKIIRL